MARQSFTFDDLMNDSELSKMFFDWHEQRRGREDTNGLFLGGPSDAELRSWYDNRDTLSYGVASGDKQGTNYSYQKQPDGSFKLVNTSTFYRPSSWVNFRDEVGIPLTVAAGAMTGLSAAGAGGALGADVAASTAAQGGFLGQGAAAAATSPLDAYLTSGGVEGSIMGGGTGGAAGSVGAGTLAEQIATNAPIMGPPADLAPGAMGPPSGLAPVPDMPTTPPIPGGTPSTGTVPTPNVNPPTGGGTPGNQQNPWGNVAGSILGLYNAEEARKRYDQLLEGLNSLYTPDSPYAMQMQDEIARRDSAAGRGSQYGPRSVELAAKLTDSRRQALGQMALPLAAITMSQNQMANNLNNLFTNTDGNILDVGKDLIGEAKDAWDWFNQKFPSIFGE